MGLRARHDTHQGSHISMYTQAVPGCPRWPNTTITTIPTMQDVRNLYVYPGCSRWPNTTIATIPNMQDVRNLYEYPEAVLDGQPQSQPHLCEYPLLRISTLAAKTLYIWYMIKLSYIYTYIPIPRCPTIQAFKATSFYQIPAIRILLVQTNSP